MFTLRCLALTCHSRFGQNWPFHNFFSCYCGNLRVARIPSLQGELTLEKKMFIHRICRGSNLRPSSHKSDSHWNIFLLYPELYLHHIYICRVSKSCHCLSHCQAFFKIWNEIWYKKLDIRSLTCKMISVCVLHAKARQTVSDRSEQLVLAQKKWKIILHLVSSRSQTLRCWIYSSMHYPTSHKLQSSKRLP